MIASGGVSGRVRPFVGRHAELDRLAKVLRRDAAAPRVAGVSGEPGIGKTRLLGEFSALARRAGRAVLWGRATEFEQEVPFGIFVNALSDRFAATAAELNGRLGEERMSLVRHLFGAPAPGAPDLVDVERFRLHRAVRALLAAMAEPDGLVLILDDVHWADDGSIELLDHLLRHPPEAGLAMVLAHRTRQLPARLHRALAEAERHGVADPVGLGPLSVAEAGELLGRSAADVTLRELHLACGGNPFYLKAFARSDRWRPGHGLDPLISTPEAVVLAAELEPLSPEELVVARAAAVAGDAFDPELVAAVAAKPLADVSATLDQLAARDLIRPTGTPGRLAYRHPLLRSVVYHGAGECWRFDAHGRAAAVLKERGVSASMRAHHVERSARHGDQASIAVLIEAAVSTMGTTPAATARWVGAALDLMPADTDTEQRLLLLGLRAKALGVTGQLRESRDVLHEALRLMPAEPPEPRAQIVGFCALIERLLGGHAEAQALLQHELSGLADPDGVAAVVLKQELASGRLVGGDFSATRDWSRSALDAARRLGDRPLIAAAIGLCAADGYVEGVVEPDTFTLLDEGAAILDALLDGDVARHLQAAVWMGWSEMFMERLDDAERHLARGIALAHATGQNHLVTYLRIGQGTTFGLLGRLGEAAVAFDDALETAMLTGSDELRTMALAQLCWITIWQGDLVKAKRIGEEAVASAGAVPDWFSGVAHCMLAQAHFYDGDPERCIEMLLGVGGGHELPELDPLSRIAWFSLLAEAGWAVGRRAEAAEWAELATVQASSLGLVLRTGFGQLAQAVARQGGSPGDAAKHAVNAAESFAKAGDRVDAGRAHLLAGVLLGEAGDTERAREEIAQARALFSACGANLFQSMAVREERRLNARGPRRRDAHTGELTRRELEVARLAGTGLTNRQIASELFVSPRTVEVHLSRILAKLDVPTRAAIAGALAGSGGDK
ncbi:MAG TPA: AAA family ATPase [Amycolatopsis sp.]|nr:AAA family ATPase [Amycolatopsis sp.]